MSPTTDDDVSKENLDDRLAVVAEHLAGREKFEDERWQAHSEKHADLAVQLRDYKASANEWQATFRDLSSNTLTRVEYQSEHKALEAKMHGEITALAGIVSALDNRVDLNTQAIKDATIEAAARRGVFSDTRSLITLAIAIIGGVATFLLILDRLTT
jgi:hypothetical protein